MGRDKRAQFFILAAVIISAIVLSFGFTSNQARINQEPENFFDLTYEVKKETGAVMDFEIYEFKENDVQMDKLGEFVDQLATDLKDRDPDANFMFFYGDRNSVVFCNYGSDTAKTSNGNSIRGAFTPIRSVIKYQGTRIEVEETLQTYGEGGCEEPMTNLGEDAFVEVEVRGEKYDFEVSKHRQVVFVIQKNEGDESYVSVR